MGLAGDRKTMIKSLQTRTVPRLRQLGFKGSFPHFRRLLADRTDLISFQFDKYGGGFIVELARAPSGDFQAYWGETVPAKKLKTYDLPPDERFRLGAKSAEGDHWFRYDKGLFRRTLSFDELSDRVSDLVRTQGEAWWTTNHQATDRIVTTTSSGMEISHPTRNQ